MIDIDDYLEKINSYDDDIKNDIHFYFRNIIYIVRLNYQKELVKKTEIDNFQKLLKENGNEIVQFFHNIDSFLFILDKIFTRSDIRQRNISNVKNYDDMIRWIYSVSQKIIKNPSVLDVNINDQKIKEIDNNLIEGTYFLICKKPLLK
jgi:hypothetical protein